MPAQNLLSIVVPVYNEEDNIRPFYAALAPVLDRLDMPAEILFVDDGSKDRSYEIVSALSQQDNRVKCLRFSRNFGSHAAILAGLHSAEGDAAVIISVDLQDPPEMIHDLVARWQEGFHVVWAVREGREDPLSKKVLAALFYRLFRRIALPDYPAKGMDFGLFDRIVLEKLKEINELNNFLPGTIVWLGFRQTHVSYYRRARQIGRSKWSVGKRVKSALDAIVSFSHFPIRAISYTGILISVMSFLYASFLIVRKVFFDLGGPGWASLMVALLFLGGVQLVMLGILGEYIWRGSEQVKGRPPYIVMETVGFCNGQTAFNPANREKADETHAFELHRMSGR